RSRGHSNASERTTMTTYMAPRYLGQILVRDLGLRPELLEQGLEKQREEGGLLGDVLLRMKAITEADLLRALATQMGLPYYAEPPRAEDIDAALVEKLPVGFAKQQKLMPLKREGEDGLVVAIADPLAVHALDDVRALVGLEPTPVLAEAQKILDVINKVY